MSASAASAPWVAAHAALRTARKIRRPQLGEAMAAMQAGRADRTEQILVQCLDADPNDVDALNLRAELLMRCKRYEEAASLLIACVANDAHFDLARFNFATALFHVGKLRPAIDQVQVLIGKEPYNPLYCDLMAAALSNLGHYREALDYRRRLTETFPDSAWGWLAFGRALRSVGKSADSVAAYRKAIDLSPSLGRAWSAWADLKTWRFTAADADSMRTQLARSDLPQEERAPLHYALGKAFGDLGAWAKSFENYARANAILRMGSSYDPGQTTARAAAVKALFTREFLVARTGSGCSAADPIFIVGMQRSGSTLVEQILASHSAIEGAGELPDFASFAIAAGDEGEPLRPIDERQLCALDSEGFRRIGEAYLAETQIRRPRGLAHFTDKQPYNFWHVGLIHLALPNARIIDVRRHPLACCFSNFIQNYVMGTAPFSHRLADLGRYYRDYTDVMAHFDRVLPGKVSRLNYEALVAEPEKQIRRLLDHLGLPFESACLEFYRNDRALDSASSEQVRSPIFTDAVDHWRNYDPWLAPLKAALGPALAG